MRVEQLDLEAYGHYAATTIDLSRPEHGLTVVFGLNEAGKSTARRALLAALFGFERDDPDAHRYGRHGLRLGVRLRSADGSELSFVRQGMSRVVGTDGALLDDGAVKAFSGGVSRALYTRLFSIDHEELRTASESLIQADGEIGRLVYGASLGSGSVASVLRRLDERANKLFQERGRAQQIPKALDAYRTRMQEAKAARVRSRDWDRLGQAVDDAEAQRAGVRAEFERARAEQGRLARIRSARPLLARRREIAGGLQTVGSVPSEDWAERAAQTLTAYREAVVAHENGLAARNRLAADVAGVDVPEELLERAGRIDKLVEGIGRYRKDTDDLPKLRTELQGAQSRLAAQLRVLGLANDDGRNVAETDLVAVEALAQRSVELGAEGRTISDELRKAEEALATARSRLSALPEARDVAHLDRILRLARPRLETIREVAEGRAEQAVAAADIAAKAGKLGLEELGQEQIEGLTVPSASEVDAERDRRESHRLQLKQLEDQRGALTANTGDLEGEIATLRVTVPDPERLGAARDHREAGWRLVRLSLEGAVVDTAWAQGAPLADTYEAAVADADIAADERYEHADDLATLAQLHAHLLKTESSLRQLDQREQALNDEALAADRRWEERWARIGVEPRTPEAMAEWLRDHRDLVGLIAAWRKRQAAIETSSQEVARQRDALSAALADGNQQPCSDQLDLLVSQADDLVERARAAAADQRVVETELRLAEEAVPKRRAVLETHDAAVADWQGLWAIALHPLSLGPGTGPNAAAVAVAAHRASAAARNEIEALERRIEGIEIDRRAYAEEATMAAVGVLASTATDTPLDIVPELKRQLAAARDALGRRETLAEQVRHATEVLSDAASLLNDARRALAPLRAEAALGPSDEEPDAGMDRAVEQARTAADLRQRLEEVESDLLEQGDGRDIAQIAAEAAGTGHTLAGAIEASIAEVDVLAKRLEEVTTQATDARRELEAVTDATTAADLEQDAQAELALAAELATKYTRTALAALVLRRTVTEYGERHRGPILARAAALFNRLTDGAFVELVPDADGDRQVLLAKRRGGELCGTAALSDGARDQLYLALRLAGVEHQLGVVVAPLPVVLDDILIHFDDTRAAAALGALAEVGQHTQVLLFTHHERVVEIAGRVVPPQALAVVRLVPRDHDQPPQSAGDADRTPLARERSGRATGTGRHAAVSEILAAARRSGGRALSKADLLDLSGVSEAQWTSAVRALVERGDLVQEGQKRGARYRASS